MRFVPLLLGLTCGLAFFGCSSSSTTTSAIVRPELLAVLPEDFLGQFPCTDKPEAGAVQSYVATLFDLTPSADGTIAAPRSSRATSCRNAVTFSNTVENHRYRVYVDAYAEAASELTPQTSDTVDPRPQGKAPSGDVAVAPLACATCGGFPPSPASDGGDAAGAGNEEQPGVVSYSGLTQTAHNCVDGLQLAVLGMCPAPQ